MLLLVPGEYFLNLKLVCCSYGVAILAQGGHCSPRCEASQYSGRVSV
jgi:hypothetical protein